MILSDEKIRELGLNNIPDGYDMFFPGDGDLGVFSHDREDYKGYILFRDINHRYITVTAERNPFLEIEDKNASLYTDPREISRGTDSDWKAFEKIIHDRGVRWDAEKKEVSCFAVASSGIRNPSMVAKSLSAFKDIVMNAAIDGPGGDAASLFFQKAQKYMDDLQYAIVFLKSAKEI